jgi:hypothetical protein
MRCSLQRAEAGPLALGERGLSPDMKEAPCTHQIATRQLHPLERRVDLWR